MLSSCMREASHECISCCLSITSTEPNKLKNHPAGTGMSSCLDFSMAALSLFPSIHFTNHESLPSLPDALSNFSRVYPKHVESEQADRIRDSEYYHLSNLTCLDYTGIGLFSHAQFHSSNDPSYPPTWPSSSLSQPTFFSIAHKPASLKSQLRYGYQETALESAIRRRIMGFLNISDDEYSMVFIGSRACAFKLLAESYPFHSNKRLLTVYDHDNEAVSELVESAKKRGVRFMSASFSWSSLRIHSAKLKKMITERNKKKKKRGLFVFPLQSRLTGARYPYKWMSLAQENGWHVVLDACALGPKEMGALGLSLTQPDFIVCSFFKIFGENPSGFSALCIKRSSSAILEASTTTTSIGLVSIIPARCPSQFSHDTSSPELEVHRFIHTEITSSSYGQIPAKISDDSAHSDNRLGDDHLRLKEKQTERHKQGETSERCEMMVTGVRNKGEQPEILQLNNTTTDARELNTTIEIECRGLDHADSMGLRLISNRLRCIIDWLVNALMKLQHPHSEDAHPLVRIYGPRRKYDRGTAVAFNVFDWKGEKVEPTLVQKLADRSNISLGCGFLQNILFPDKYEDKHVLMERRVFKIRIAGNRVKEKIEWGITVVNASFGFLNNFEDAYRLWAFVSKFLDADFVEKEKWRYMALDQKLIEV
ncbi:uncharacterized protein LOC103716846 [Phoenix dactylifera]|uniref:Uncharacterized protein LOC103716846 n=1 Tax=Phoenix dactylifera TaxID=42345 RepID=A0A8B7CNW8_PHODC|nr:uncharacterized protein LOC103716846 [Phoenix dactylifera]